jgi:threonine dehydratase
MSTVANTRDVTTEPTGDGGGTGCEGNVFPRGDLDVPPIEEIYAARTTARCHLPAPPVVRSGYLSGELDAEVYLQRFDVLPTGSFKPLGYFHLVEGLDDEYRENGLITASMGNQGQALAYAADHADMPGVVVVPETLDNPGKVASMERLGATVLRHGEDIDEARSWARERADAEGMRFINGGNEPELIAGRAGAGLDALDAVPSVDVVFSPVGGGSLAAAYCLSVGHVADAAVVGVQAEGADAVYRSWTSGRPVSRDRVDTIAEGIATRIPFELTLDILCEHAADMTLVTDDAIADAIEMLVREESIVGEGAGVASVAAARTSERSLAGETVLLPISGANLAHAKLKRILTAE